MGHYLRGRIREAQGVCATTGTAPEEKRLFNWQNQASLTSGGRLLGECRMTYLLGHKSHFLLILLTFLVGLANGKPSKSAEIVHTNTEYCEYTLQGVIYNGDNARLISMGWFPPNDGNAWDYPLHEQRLCLNSPGGSIEEGLRIFESIREAVTTTIVAPGMICESACALAFLGGSSFHLTRNISNSRFIYPGARLGFHAPNLLLEEGQIHTAEEVLKAYSLAIETTSILVSFSAASEMTGTLLREMLSTPPDSFFTIDNVITAAISNIDVIGLNADTISVRELLENACDMSYLREYETEYWNPPNILSAPDREYQDYFRETLSSTANWRSEYNQKTIYVYDSAREVRAGNNQNAKKWEPVFIGAVSGYPYHVIDGRSQRLLCIARAESPDALASTWNGRSQRSDEFISELNATRISVSFYEYNPIFYNDDLERFISLYPQIYPDIDLYENFRSSAGVILRGGQDIFQSFFNHPLTEF